MKVGRKVAVIGAGIMGSGIAQTAAMGGFEVVIEDDDRQNLSAGLERIGRRLEKAVSEDNIRPDTKDEILSRIKPASNLEDCREADIIIEAVVEKLHVKGQVFKDLDRICPDKTIFATNTSSIPVTLLGQLSGRPERFAGMHFMNPAHIMKLIEVIKGVRTADATVKIIKTAAQEMGKTPVVVNDSAGFISTRLLLGMINDAIFCFHEGLARKEDIDAIMKLGANHPMGPLEMADLIGLDTCLEILDVLRAEHGEKYLASPLLRRMVDAGKLGRKNGEGFYEYK